MRTGYTFTSTAATDLGTYEYFHSLTEPWAIAAFRRRHQERLRA